MRRCDDGWHTLMQRFHHAICGYHDDTAALHTFSFTFPVISEAGLGRTHHHSHPDVVGYLHAPWRDLDLLPARRPQPYAYRHSAGVAGSPAFVELGHHGFPGGYATHECPTARAFPDHGHEPRRILGCGLLAPATVWQMLTPQYPWLDPSIGLHLFKIWQGGDVLIGYGEAPGVNMLLCAMCCQYIGNCKNDMR